MKKAIVTMVAAVTGIALSKKTKYDGMQLLFYKEALGYGHHGSLRANSVQHKLDNALVRFVFPGLTVAPQMTPELLAHIWDRAAAAGFEALFLVDYGTKVPTRAVTSPAGAVKDTRKLSEDAKAGMGRDIPVPNLSPLSHERALLDAGGAFDTMNRAAQQQSLLRQQSAAEVS